MLHSKNAKKRGCKWCKAPFESLVKEEKTVKVYDGKKVLQPPKGYKYVAKMVVCKECGGMNRFYNPKLVEVKEK